MRGSEIRQKRMGAGICGRLLCTRAGLDRARLTNIEKEYLTPSGPELERLETALAALVEAKSKLVSYAAQLGWPVGTF